MNLWEGLILFFAFQALWVSVLILLSKKGKKVAKWIWFVFLLLFAYNIFSNVMYWSELDENLAKRLSLVWMIPLSLYGPLFLLYIRMVIGKMPSSTWMVAHSLPTLMVLLIFGKYYALPIEYRDVLFANDQMDAYIGIDPFYVQVFLALLLLVYAVASFVQFRKHYQHNIKDGKWIEYLSILFIGFALSWVAYYILEYTEILTEEQDYVITGFMIAFVLLQSFLVYKKPNVLVDWQRIKEAAFALKYRKTGMSNEVSLEFKEKLLALMENERPYLNPELKLDDLASLLGLSRHHMSQVINQHFHKSFFDFLNEYRIKEAKLMLLDRPKDKQVLTIEVIYKVGFNNKASFYKAFKKYVGTSPSDFVAKELRMV